MPVLLEKPMMRVQPLKAGLSSRTKAGNNPVSTVDPSGLKIVVDPTATRADQQKLNWMLDEIYKTDSGRSLIDDLNAAPQTIVLRRRFVANNGVGLCRTNTHMFRRGGPNNDWYMPENEKIYVDIDFGQVAALRAAGVPVEGFLVVGHEMGHAHQAIYRTNDYVWGVNLRAQGITRTYMGNQWRANETHSGLYENKIRQEHGYPLRTRY